MEKTKLTVFDVLHNWKKLNVAQKRAFLTVALFALAALLLLVALILGVASCRAKTASQANAGSAAPIPALLQPPKQAEEQIPDGNETTDPDRIDDPADGTDEPGGETGAEATASPAPGYQVLKKHDSGEEVTKLQTRLMELGYLEIEEPTDYFGNSTAYAVSLFQRQHGLEQDGVAGEQTQTLLYGRDAQHYMMVEGAEGRDVKMLQEQLVDLGYLSEGEVDRVYGEKTIEAVKAFQKRNGLSADGKAGEKTLEKLYSDGAKISKALEERQKAEEKAQKEKEKKEAAAAATKKTGKTATPTPKKDTKVDKFIKAANSKIGCEYVLGDKGPNTFDCSGFVYYCLKQAGVSTIRMNAAGFSRVSRWKNVTKISDLQKGDILFFKSDSSSTVSHCGIYIGGGMMIDASSANGKVVKRAVSNYWKRNFVNARRPWS
ncbi:MAG: peptidoglycan-binding protein [Clostridia bacterium]|nr:peptidoglycan-binding protein [Clostridia bacterium]